MASLTAFEQLQQLSRKTKVGQKTEKVEDIGKTFLLVSINQTKVYIDACDISEVIDRAKVSSVGHTVPWFKGLVKVKGEVYSLVDVAPFLKVSPSDKKQCYTVALSSDYDNVAIAVDGLFGLHSVEEIKSKREKGYLDIYKTEQGEMQVLAFQRLVSSDKFFAVSVFSN